MYFLFLRSLKCTFQQLHSNSDISGVTGLLILFCTLTFSFKVNSLMLILNFLFLSDEIIVVPSDKGLLCALQKKKNWSESILACK